MSYVDLMFEDFQSRLDGTAGVFQMRKQRLGGSAMSHLGSQGTTQNMIPSTYRAPGPAMATGQFALSHWKPRNGLKPSPMAGKSGGKLYKPRKPESIRTKAGSIWKVLSNA